MHNRHHCTTSVSQIADILASLVSAELIDEGKKQRVQSALKSTRRPVEDVLLELGFVTDRQLAEALSRHFSLDIANANEFPVELPSGIDWDEAFLKRTGIVPLSADESTLTLATAKPTEPEAATALGFHVGRVVELKVTSASEISRQSERLLSKASDIAHGFSSETDILASSDVERLKDAARDAPVVKAVTELFAEALERNSSDIHIEPAEDRVIVRVRIDGVLQQLKSFPLGFLPGVVSRLKILSGMNIAEQRLPQDGRIRMPVRGRETDFRLSTMPVVHGESIAIRILANDHKLPDLKDLGFSPDCLSAFERMIGHSNGIVLVTGPTGSGKTTTLHAAMRKICTGTHKAFTVEDPVEYHLAGVNQIPIKPQIGLDFAAVLRSVLRQDPDIIMVGEIRDKETAEIATRASMTGHLVLSSLHTNSAAASVIRLFDLGIEPYLIGSTLRGVVAQRLIRKLCSNCKTSVAVTAADRRRWPGLQAEVLFEAAGCALCGGAGFKGRTVVAEFIEAHGDISQVISANASEVATAFAARTNGGLSLLESGLATVARGVTSLAELEKLALQ